MTPRREGSLDNCGFSKETGDSGRGSPALVPGLLPSSLLSLRVQGGMERGE